jgi:hypothetical protein
MKTRSVLFPSFVGLAALFVSVGCSGAPEGEDVGTGSDDVTANLSVENVGEVALGKNLCSGFLIDKDTVITAASCALGQEVNDGEFRLGRTQADDDEGAPEAAKFQTLNIDFEGNLAILKLDRAYPATLDLGKATSTETRLLVFDHANRKAVASAPCSMKADGALVKHNCRVEGASAGGALVQNGRVVALDVGQIDNQPVGLALENASEPSAASASALRPMEHSNRNDVRAAVAAGGWQVVWGDLINEADVASGALAAITGTFGAWVQYQINEQIEAFSRSAGDAAVDVIKQALKQAFNNGEIRVSDKLGVKAGLATYNRWERVVYDVPSCSIRGCKMKRKENRIPLPNNHQPFAAFRLF